MLGALAAFNRGTWLDKVFSATAITGVSLPHYWVGIVLVAIFAVILGVLPAQGMGAGGVPTSWEQLRFLVLPVVTLSLIPMGVVSDKVMTGRIRCWTCSQLVGTPSKPMPCAGKHIENDGEDRHQHDTHPVVRQADADDRGRGEQLVEPGVVIVCSQRAQQHSEQEAQHCRRQCEHEGIAQRAEQLLRHRPVGEEGDAEISDQKAAEPGQILHVHRLIEAEAPAQAVRDLLRHLRRHQDVDDVPGARWIRAKTSIDTPSRTGTA